LKKSKSKPHLLILSIVFFILSFGVGLYTFGSGNRFFNDSGSGSFVGLAAACLIGLIAGFVALFEYFLSFFPEKADKND